MFKSLNKAIERRSEAVSSQMTVNRLVAEFLNRQPNQGLRSSNIKTSLDSDRLILTLYSENKPLANELFFHLGPLAQFLKEQKIRINKIIIK